MPLFQNNARQRKDNYRFVVDNSSETYPIDWYNAYLEVDFQLVTLADSAVGITAGANNGNQDATTTNGNTFIKEIQVECNGTSVYTNSKANQATNALTLLKYTKVTLTLLGKTSSFMWTLQQEQQKAVQRKICTMKVLQKERS